MSPDLSFETLVCRLQAGDEDAAAQVFRRFAHRLVGLASARLGQLLRPKVDPADVVQSVFKSFFTRQRDDEFVFSGWDGLWAVLVAMTVRKCCNRAEYFQAACRDVRRETAWPLRPGESGGLASAVAREPTPADAAELAEAVERLLGRFPERERGILRLGLEGYPVVEISAQVGCTERKVYRVLARVREELRRMGDETSAGEAA